MRIVPLIIAILLGAGLYMIIFQRDMITGREPDVMTVSQTEDAFAPPAQTAGTDQKPVSVVATHSVSRPLDSAVILRGETQAAREVSVTAETAGRVVNDPLRKGTYVTAGQMLCEIDPGTRAASLAQAKAARAEAEVGLNNARKLAEGGYASETQVLAAEAGIEAARASVAQIERDIENLTITAPFAGLLESDTAEFGTLLSAGAVCATVIQLDPIKLVAFAPETEVARIELGAMAGARLVSGETVKGAVSFLSRSADPSTRTFRVEVEIPNADNSIRDGQTVEMAISSDGVDAHLVAQSSLTLNDEGQIGLRIVGQDSLTDFVPVTILRDTREGIWVSGLGKEADIITVGQEFVRAGVLIEPHFETETAKAMESDQ